MKVEMKGMMGTRDPVKRPKRLFIQIFVNKIFNSISLFTLSRM